MTSFNCYWPAVVMRSIVCAVCCVCIFLANQVESQEIPVDHPAMSGTTMRFPLERSGAMPHVEGILGRCFPNIHGNEALHFDYVYTSAVFNNARGGAQTKGGTVYNGLFEFGITADTEKLGLWKNGTFFVQSIFSQGRSPSRYVGDYQNVYALAYETPAQVSEYWLEQGFLNNALKIRAGKQTADGDFFYLDSTADFINESNTTAPVTHIPATPETAWGITGYLDLTDSLCFKFGIFDAKGNANKFWMSESGDVYSLYQIEYHYSVCPHLPGTAYFAGWYDNSETELLNRPGETKTGNYGFNFGIEQMIYRRHICNKDDRRGITLFFKYNESKEDRNELKDYWGLGLHWLGPLENRPQDSFGVAVNTVRFSQGYRVSEGLTKSHESSYEIFYKIQMTKNITVQPVFQYVVNPSGMYRDSFVPGLVLQMIF